MAIKKQERLDITADKPEEYSLRECLLSDPILKDVDSRELARLLVHLQQRELTTGETLFSENEEAKFVFLITRGHFSVSIPDAGTVKKDEGCLGEEAILGSDVYRKTVSAGEPSTVIAIPARELHAIVNDNGGIRKKFFESYIGKYDKMALTPGQLPEDEIEKSEPSDVSLTRELTGWLLTFLCPLLIYFFLEENLGENAAGFLAIISAATIMWVFQLMPDFVPPFFSILMVILLDIAPSSVALSGFTSGTFFTCLSVFGIGAIMVSSGLTYRVVLYLLKLLPATQFWYSTVLFSVGAVMTPIVPPPAGRMAMVIPLLSNFLEMGGKRTKDLLATLFVSSTLNGVILLSTIFLTGKAPNLMIYGLFDRQTQFSFQWGHWFWAASFTGGIMLFLYFIISKWYFRKASNFSMPKSVVSDQLSMLGRMSSGEWVALAAIGVLAVGIPTASFHKIDIPWLTMSIIVSLLLVGFFKVSDLRTRIDWSLMIFIGSIVAWAPIMNATGLDTVIIEVLGPLGDYMKNNLLVFIFLLSFSIIIVRLALPAGVTVIIFATALFPIAMSAGITPWLIGFIVLMMSESPIFPYQTSFSIQLQNELAHKGFSGAYDEKRIVMMNLFMIVVRVVAVYASIPFWKFINII